MSQTITSCLWAAKHELEKTLDSLRLDDFYDDLDRAGVLAEPERVRARVARLIER